MAPRRLRAVLLNFLGYSACIVLCTHLAAQIPGQVFLTDILRQGLANPSVTFASSAESVPPKHYPVYLRFKGKRCKTCRFEINSAWINGKRLRHGKLSWEFESLSGEKPYLLKIDVDELWDGKVVRSRVLYGDLTTQAFTDVISLDLVVP
ncbi:MAG: hypothetical protein ACOY5B_10865 [Spirochaetota bacterium]